MAAINPKYKCINLFLPCQNQYFLMGLPQLFRCSLWLHCLTDCALRSSESSSSSNRQANVIHHNCQPKSTNSNYPVNPYWQLFMIFLMVAAFTLGTQKVTIFSWNKNMVHVSWAHIKSNQSLAIPKFRGHCLKIRDVCMDFEPYSKVTASLFTLKASYLVKWPISTWSFMWWCLFINLLKFETRPSSMLNFRNYGCHFGMNSWFFTEPCFTKSGKLLNTNLSSIFKQFESRKCMDVVFITFLAFSCTINLWSTNIVQKISNITLFYYLIRCTMMILGFAER